MKDVLLTFSPQSLPKMVLAFFILTQFHYHCSQKLSLSTTSHWSCLLVPYLPNKSKSHHWTFQCKLTDIISCCFVYVSTTIWWIQTALFLEDRISDKISRSTKQILNKLFFSPQCRKHAISCFLPSSRVRFAYAILTVLFLVARNSIYLQNSY